MPSAENVADEGTKCNQHTRMDGDSRWFRAPEFVALSPKMWPETYLPGNTDLEVLHHIQIEPTSNSPLSMIMPKAERFSKWEKFRSAQRYVLCFLQRLMRQPAQSKHLQLAISCPTIEGAENLVIRNCQREAFGEEINCLKRGSCVSRKSHIFKCSPYLDNAGLLRVKGRIDAAEGVQFDTKRPIILPSKSLITTLIVDFYHRKYHHLHKEIVVNEIRQKYWINGLRTLVSSTGRRCCKCIIRKAQPRAPEMGSLQPERLALNTRPFTYTGVDYFGPIDVLVGRRREKRWGVLFTCLTVRAVHIEISHSLPTDAFLLVFKQFTSRRGVPRRVLSDNATNFRGASRILLIEMERLSSDEIEQRYPEIEWCFIPPNAPPMGGAWERMIRSVKSILFEILREEAVQEYILRAVLADVECILNSRPLTYVPLETSYDEALTPNHFLTGSSSGLRERGTEDDSGIALRRNLRISSQMADRFWKRFVREYLPCLTRRSKWYENPPDPIDVGDIVIVVDDKSKRNTWLKGIVMEVHRANDGQSRSAAVKTASGMMPRPVVKLAKLDLVR